MHSEYYAHIEMLYKQAKCDLATRTLITLACIIETMGQHSKKVEHIYMILTVNSYTHMHDESLMKVKKVQHVFTNT